MELSSLWKRYDLTIWIRVIGTILTTLTSFAIRPFLAIYLYNKTGNLYYIGIILGLSPLMGVFTNLLAGSLADKYGRKPMMAYSLVFQGVSMLGYMFAVTPLHFCLVSMLNGIASSLYFPAANAQIADIVPEAQRAEVFALMHTALNVGAAVGPMLGLLMVKINQNLAFLASSISLFLYALLVFALIPETLARTKSQAGCVPVPAVPAQPRGQNSGARIRNTQELSSGLEKKPERLKLKEHRLLFGFTLLSMPITLLYAQVESNFPLYLRANFDNYITIFTSLMTMNGIIVVLTAVWLAQKTQKISTHYVLLAGYLLFALVAAGYGFGPWSKIVPVLFVAEVIFTVAECITFPNQNKLISLIAPESMRGRYFSIFNLNWGLSKSIGPILGAAIFTHAGGLALFLSISGLLVISGIFAYAITGHQVFKVQGLAARTLGR